MKSFKSFLNEVVHGTTKPSYIPDPQFEVPGTPKKATSAQKMAAGISGPTGTPNPTPSDTVSKILHIDPRVSNASRGSNFMKDIGTLEDHGVTKPEGLSKINFSDETEGRFDKNDENQINKHLEALRSKNAGNLKKMKALELDVRENGNIHSKDAATDHVLEALNRFYKETKNHSGAQHPFKINNIKDPHISSLIGEMRPTYSPVVYDPSQKPYGNNNTVVGGKPAIARKTIADVITTQYVKGKS